MEKALHMAMMVPKLALRYGTATCLKVRNRNSGKWQKVSWYKVDEQVMRTACAMVEFGVDEHACVGIYSENMDKFIYTDLAAYSIRAISVPIYATSSPAQVKYIVEDAGIRLLFVGSQLQYNNAFKVWKESETLHQIIVFDPSVTLNPEDSTTQYYYDFLKLGDSNPAQTEVRVRRAKALGSDVASIIYTSGTSGESKGVVLTHKNMTSALQAHMESIPDMNHKHTSMNFLPLTHIFEKMWVLLCMQRGVKVAVGENPKEILRNLAEVRPHFMCNVPRFWEKVYIGVRDKIEHFPPHMRKLTEKAIAVGHSYKYDYLDKGLTPPLSLKVQYELYDRTLFSKVRKTVGIDKGRMFPTAGAALPVHICEFLESIGIPIIIGYGLTETTATVTYCRPGSAKKGSIGTPLEGVQVRIDPKSSEIQVKGDTVMREYLHKPELTAEAFTEDGWFRTGDMGEVDDEGYYYFKERLKDLTKTANGKYIAPQVIEGLLTSNKFIEQAMLIAEGRSFVSALIYPNWEAVRSSMEKRDIRVKNMEELYTLPEVEDLIEGNLEEVQKDLAQFEKVKRFYILQEPFSIENGQLTDSLKMKRRVIMDAYADEIEEMYARPYTPSES